MLEVLTNIFWLSSWAVLASYADAWNVTGVGRTFAPRQGLLAALPSIAKGPAEGPANMAGLAEGPAGVLTANLGASMKSADIALAFDAALGAVIWVLFIVTLLSTSE